MKQTLRLTGIFAAAVLTSLVVASAAASGQQQPVVGHASTSSVQVTPRSAALPLGSIAPSPSAVKPAVGGITGYVYWDVSAAHYKLANPCQGLTLSVSSIASPHAGGGQVLRTTSSFTPVGPLQDQTTAGIPTYMLCEYSLQKMPTGMYLRVSLTIQASAFFPAVSVQSPQAFEIFGGNCNSSTANLGSLSYILTGGELVCGDNAFNVNFKLNSTAGRLQQGSATAPLMRGNVQGALSSNSVPVEDSVVTPDTVTRATLLPSTTNASQNRANAGGTTGMLVPAVKPGGAASSQRGPIPGALAPKSTGSGAGAVAPSPATSRPGPQTGIPSTIPPNPGLTNLNNARRANMLKGFVDLHTHPLSNLAFGGKLVYGGVDIGSLLPADPNCNHGVHATSMQQALGHDNSTHGGWGTDNGCGDDIRVNVIHQLQQANTAADPPDDAYGAPDFKDWPVWNDITHQKMWVDWIYRAYQAGLRVMVALAVNNKTLGDATAGPGDYPTDDKSSADLQIREIKNFVQRHSNFMEIAYSSGDVQRIVKSNKLAIVLGVEVDNIGNAYAVRPLTTSAISAEISRLYNEGVRYIFPIHIIDNPFGGTAVYEGAFNISNYQMNGKFWDLECSNPADQIGYIYKPTPLDVPMALVETVKLHFIAAVQPPNAPACSTGDENSKGLTRLGEFAIKEMMRRGMLIDIDHMSQKSANRALELAEAVSGGYPLFSGHNTPRGLGGVSENQRTPQQYARIAKLGGMAGVGTACRNSYQWLKLYGMVVQSMGQQSEALGTDFNGLVKGMPPRYGSSYEDCDHPRDHTVSSHISYSPFFPKSQLGSKSWDYNTDGVAHYGMLAEFLMDARTGPNGAYLIDNNLMYGAETFFEAWQKAESEKKNVN